MTEEQRSLANRPESGMARVKNYMLSPEVKERFEEMMGTNGIYYLNQVLIVVASSEDLQRCDPKSILIAAMRAASLKLSVDPSSGQAWIVPYKGQANFQLGYKGVYELALRTNLYRFINVVDVYEGETIVENRMTGIHNLSGSRKSDKVWARMLYFQLYSGYEKTFIMTVEEIEAHAKHYSQGYNNPRSKWHDPTERPKMERKTVLSNGLRKWGRFNDADRRVLEEIESEQTWVAPRDRLPDEDQVTTPEPFHQSEEQNLNDLGFGKNPGDPAASPEPQKEPGQSQSAPAAEKPWTDPRISLATAKAEKSTEGTPYWDLKTDQLTVRFNSLQKSLKDNHLEPKDREEKMIKRDVIQAILAYRAQEPLL